MMIKEKRYSHGGVLRRDLITTFLEFVFHVNLLIPFFVEIISLNPYFYAVFNLPPNFLYLKFYFSTEKYKKRIKFLIFFHFFCKEIKNWVKYNFEMNTLHWNKIGEKWEEN